MGGRIVVFGSYVTDLTGRGTRFPVPGETVLGASFQMGPGGKGSNQAVAAFRAGGDVTLVTKLGRDAFGRAARDFYTAEGMNTGEWIEDETCETGAALIMVNQQSGQNMIMVLNGACSHITPEDVRAKQTLIEQADVLLVQMEINVDALEHVIRIAHESGVRVILNPAPVQKIADEMMAMVDTVTPNETAALPPRFQTEWSCLTRFAMETAPARFPSPSRGRPKPCLARRKSTRFIRRVTADEQPF